MLSVLRFKSMVMSFACIAVIALAGCIPETKSQDDQGYGLSGYDPNADTTLAAACEARGGKYRPAGLSRANLCFEVPKDAGQSCSASTQCEGSCLARSNSCSPIAPLFGCNAILDSSGREVTLCRD